jgi:hypothetical protein
MDKQAKTRKLGKAFLKDLHVLAGFEFPMKCLHCGRIYDTVEQFLEETEATDNLNGIIEGHGVNMERIVEVLRKCECGKLLVEEFEDRRDGSPDGIEHRFAFSRLVRDLRISGMTREEAHASLLGLTYGFDSEQLRSVRVA